MAGVEIETKKRQKREKVEGAVRASGSGWPI
jgi:hypothetical protein